MPETMSLTLLQLADADVTTEDTLCMLPAQNPLSGKASQKRQEHYKQTYPCTAAPPLLAGIREQRPNSALGFVGTDQKQLQ